MSTRLKTLFYFKIIINNKIKNRKKKLKTEIKSTYLYEKYTNVHTTKWQVIFAVSPISSKKYSKELVNMLYIKKLLYKSVRTIHGGLEYVNE